MKWKVLKTEADYNKAAIRMMEIFHFEPGTAESDELYLLIVLKKITMTNTITCLNLMLWK
jgi:HTH-type transcriptional regulator/antitoxin HigA